MIYSVASVSSILVLTSPDKCDDRREDDFYPTPWEATEALMNAEEPWLRQFDEVDEPACGEGHMADVIRGHGKTVHSSDLVYRGYGRRADFLSKNFERKGAALISNPPFSHAEDFIKQAYALRYEYIAMILKCNYWHTSGRLPLWHSHKPVRVYPYSWRIDFTGGGGNHFDCIAVIWIPGSTEKCEYCDPLEKPKFLTQPTLF